MAVQDLITEIYNKIPLVYFEMEYNYEIDPHTIDLRLYQAGEQGAETIKDIILDFDFNGVIDAHVEIPTQSEIDNCFSGFDFVSVVIGVDRNVARGEKDNFFFNDAGRML